MDIFSDKNSLSYTFVPVAQASHVVNKVASSAKKQKAKAEAAATAAKGHALEIDGDQKGVAHLPG